MSDKFYDIVFLALARDCADTIPGAVQALHNMHMSGFNVIAYVGENGSRDETRKLLEQSEASGLLKVVDTSPMDRIHGRLQRMAVGRQLVAAQAGSALSFTHAVCVFDLDEPFLEHLDLEVLRGALGRLLTGKFFAVSATSRPTYYDLLAFENDQQSFSDLEERIQKAQRDPLKYYAFIRRHVYDVQQQLTSDFDIECISAFNGLCLYSAQSYRTGSYMPPFQDSWICEHVTFNRSIATASGMRMIIDASLVLPMPSEHGRKTFPGFVWQRLLKVQKKAKVWAKNQYRARV